MPLLDPTPSHESRTREPDEKDLAVIDRGEPALGASGAID